MDDDQDTNIITRETDLGGSAQMISVTSVKVSIRKGDPTAVVDGAPLGSKVKCSIVLPSSEEAEVREAEVEGKEKEKERHAEEAEREKSRESAREGEEALKGRRVKKKFGRKKYLGEVTAYDGENKWYHIKYEDGDEEDLTWPELEDVLMPLLSPSPTNQHT